MPKLGLALLAIIAIVVIVMLFMPTNGDRNSDSVDSTRPSATSLSPGLSRNFSNLQAGNLQSTNVPSGGLTLTKAGVRKECRVRCGGPKPLAPITRKQKERKACHANCRATIAPGMTFGPNED